MIKDKFLSKVVGKIKGKSSKVFISRKYISDLYDRYQEANDMYYVFRAKYNAACRDVEKYKDLYEAERNKDTHCGNCVSNGCKITPDNETKIPEEGTSTIRLPLNTNKYVSNNLYGKVALENLDLGGELVTVNTSDLIDKIRYTLDKVKALNEKMSNLEIIKTENDSLKKSVETLTKARNTAVKQLNDLREEYVNYKNAEPEEVKYKLIKWETTNSGLGDNIYKIAASTSTDFNMIDEYILMRRDTRGYKMFYRVDTNQGIYQRTKKNVAEEEGYFIIDEPNMMVTFIPGTKDQK